MSTFGGGPGMVRMFGTVTRVAVLAVADWESVSGYGGRLWRRRAPPSGASQLVVPGRERQDMIRRFHD